MRFRTPDVVIGIGGAGKEVLYRLFTGDNERVEGPSDLREWVVEEVMDPRDESNHLNESLDAFVVDTDTDEKSDDLSLIDDINGAIADKHDQYDVGVTGPELSYVNIAEQGLTTAGELTSSSEVEAIARETGLRCWWLDNDNPRMVNAYDDYGGGVIRKRAISKALFFSSQLDADDPIEDLLDDIDDGDDVAVVVGLGGGTGSGVFLDLAKAINRNLRQCDVDLFGILPRFGEEDDVGANANAALSELEYLAITDQNPFENMLLFPYVDGAKVSEFDEAIVQGLLSYYRLKEGGNWADILNEQEEGRGPPRFAPFTLVVPQVVRFRGAGIAATQENFEEYHENKLRVLDVERELYDAVERFLEKEYPDVYDNYENPRTAPDHFALSEGEVASLHESLEAVEELVNLGVMENIGADIAEPIADQFAEAKQNALEVEDVAHEDASREERRRALVLRLPDRFEDVDNFGANDRMDKKENQMLTDLFRREMETVRRRRDLLRAKNRIETDPDLGADIERFDVREAEDVSEGLDIALNRRVTRETTEAIDGNISSFGTKQRELQKLIDDLRVVEDAVASKLAADLDDWTETVADDLTELANLYEYREDIESRLQDLREAVDAAVDAAHRAEKPGHISFDPIGFDEYERLNEQLAACGLDPIDRDDVEGSVDAMRRARQLWLRSQPSGTLDSVKRWFTGSGNVEDLEREYFEQWTRANEAEDSVVYVPQWDDRLNNEQSRVRVGMFDSRLDALENRERNLLNAVEEALSGRVVDPEMTVEAVVDDWAEESLNDRTHLERLDPFGTDLDDFDVEATVSGAVAENGDADAVLSELTDADGGAVHALFREALLGDVSHELTVAENDLARLRTAVETYREVEAVVERGAEFARATTDEPEPGEIPATTDGGHDRGIHIHRLTPEDPGKLLEKRHIGETDLWHDPLERSHLDKSLNEFVNRIDDSAYLPVHRFAFDVPDRDPEVSYYDAHRALFVFASRAFDDQRSKDAEAVVDEVASTVEEKHSFERSAETIRWRRWQFAGPWDVTMTLFFGGVMLDNLDVFYKGGDGYREKYDLLREKFRGSGGDDSDSILVRHTHGLDGLDRGTVDGHRLVDDGHDGAYLYRDRFLNVRDDDDVFTILDNLRNTRAMVDELLDRYDITGIDSAVPLDEPE